MSGRTEGATIHSQRIQYGITLPMPRGIVSEQIREPSSLGSTILRNGYLIAKFSQESPGLRDILTAAITAQYDKRQLVSEFGSLSMLNIRLNPRLVAQTLRINDIPVGHGYEEFDTQWAVQMEALRPFFIRHYRHKTNSPIGEFLNKTPEAQAIDIASRMVDRDIELFEGSKERRDPLESNVKQFIIGQESTGSKEFDSLFQSIHEVTIKALTGDPEREISDPSFYLLASNMRRLKHVWGVKTADEDKREVPLAKNARAWHPFLRPEQVTMLFKHLRTPGHTINDLINDPEFVSQEELQGRKWQNVLGLSKDIADVLVACNYKYLVSQAIKYSKSPLARGIEFKAIFNAAELGMRKAMEIFDPAYIGQDKKQEKIKFLSFAPIHIRDQVQILFRQEHGLNKYQFIQYNKLTRIRYTFFQVTGRYPTEGELREQILYHTELSQPISEFIINFHQSNILFSLDSILRPRREKHTTGKPIDLYGSVPDISPAEAANKDETSMQREAIASAFQHLTVFQREVIMENIGMTESGEPLAAFEIAAKHNISEAEVEAALLSAYAVLKDVKVLTPMSRGRMGSRVESSETQEVEPVDEELYQRALSGEGMKTRERVRILSARLPARKIATIINVGYGTVTQVQRDLRRKEGLKVVREKYGKKPEWIEKTDEIIHLYNSNAGYKAIADELSLSVVQINAAIKELIGQKRITKRNAKRPERIRQNGPPSAEIALVGEWMDANSDFDSVWKDGMRLWEEFEATRRHGESETLIVSFGKAK